MLYTASDIAKYITNKCVDDFHPISNLQLQKIMYYIQHHFLTHGSELFDDDFEAWKFGPVIPYVYSIYCGFGGTPINEKLETQSIDSKVRNVVNNFVEKMRDMDPWFLVQQTHKPNCAWALTYANGKGAYNVIDKDLIRTKAF
ncbi:MAG: DUF4065 domain-containing protein [Treponema sp.]|uniref:Panacea domain-containing protein n=1 Tax=Treponema sp. TaxID=166 RepID=UPI002A91EBC7|nr:type II toxin-antitoxin system antitoxin SocA domain-containing protein [Treponema sp.]MDY6396453.1 DUF4065 domain-containing protein [Treponema sp.]